MAMDPYGGDPLIQDLGEGGQLVWDGGQPCMSSGIENAAYLSLFVEANWWGNDIDQANPGAVGSANFLPLTDRATLTPGLLVDLKKAAEADLAWMIADGVADSVAVVISMPSTGLVEIAVTITEPSGAVTATRWKLNWARLAQEIA